MIKSTTDTNGLLLSGLDGANPLAFLAALGTLRVLTDSSDVSTCTLRWWVEHGKWQPWLTGPITDRDTLVELLMRQLSSQTPTAWRLSKKLPFEAEVLRQAVKGACHQSSTHDREDADVLSAFGSEIASDERGQFADTALRMVRSGDSAGQGMLDYARKIRESTSSVDVYHCLFEPWHYRTAGSSLRWDPIEAREYALLASDPSKDGALSVIGANRLALEAMPLFSTMLDRKELRTIGFHQIDGRKEMTWPIWVVPLGLETVRSLLTLPSLAAPEAMVPTYELQARGVATVFRSRLFKPNKYYSNLAPARAVMT